MFCDVGCLGQLSQGVPALGLSTAAVLSLLDRPRGRSLCMPCTLCYVWVYVGVFGVCVRTQLCVYKLMALPPSCWKGIAVLCSELHCWQSDSGTEPCSAALIAGRACDFAQGYTLGVQGHIMRQLDISTMFALVIALSFTEVLWLDTVGGPILWVCAAVVLHVLRCLDLLLCPGGRPWGLLLIKQQSVASATPKRTIGIPCGSS